MTEVKQSVPMCDRCSNLADIECAKCGAPEDPVLLCLACSSIMHMGNGRLSRHNFIDLATKKYQEALKVSYEHSSRDVGILKSKMKQFTMATDQATCRSKEFGRHIKSAYEQLQGLLKQRCLQFFNEVDADNAKRIVDMQKCTNYCNKLISDSASIKRELSSLETDSSDQLTVHLGKLEDRMKGLDVSHVGTLYPCLDPVYSIDFDSIEKSINSLTFTITDPPGDNDKDEGKAITEDGSGKILNPLDELEDSVSEVSVQSAITKTGEFWVDRQGNHDVHDKLYSLSQLIRREYITDTTWHTADLYQLQKGDLCYCFHTNDNMWCRTVVEEILIKQKKVSVRYLDYGNVEMVEKARILPHRELSRRQLPYQAIWCCLFSRSDDLEMSREVQWSFNDLVKCETLKCRFLKKIPGNQSESAWYVELIMHKESGETNMETHMRELIGKGNRHKAAISCRDIRLLENADLTSISTNVSNKAKKDRASDKALPSSSSLDSVRVGSPGKVDDQPTDLTDQLLSVLRASSLASVDSSTTHAPAKMTKASSETKVKTEQVITILKRPPSEANVSDEKIDVFIVGSDERAANVMSETIAEGNPVVVEPGEPIILPESDDKDTQPSQAAGDVERSSESAASDVDQGGISLEDISCIASSIVNNYINVECNTKEEENENLERVDEMVEQTKSKSMGEKDVMATVMCDPTQVEEIDKRKETILRGVDNSQTEDDVTSYDGTGSETDVSCVCNDEQHREADVEIIAIAADLEMLMTNATHVEAEDCLSNANLLKADDNVTASGAASGNETMRAVIDIKEEGATIEIKDETETHSAAIRPQDDGDIKRNTVEPEEGVLPCTVVTADETYGFAAEAGIKSKTVEIEGTEVAMSFCQAIYVSDLEAENTKAGEDCVKLHESATANIEDRIFHSEGGNIEASEAALSGDTGCDSVNVQDAINTGAQMAGLDNSSATGVNNTEGAAAVMDDTNQLREDETQIKIANIAKQVVMSIIGQAVQEVNRSAENGMDTHNGCSSEMPMYHYAGFDDVTVDKIDRDPAQLDKTSVDAHSDIDAATHDHNTVADCTTPQSDSSSQESVNKFHSGLTVKSESSCKLPDTETKPQYRENIHVEHSYSASRSDTMEQCSWRVVQSNHVSGESVGQQLTWRDESGETDEGKRPDTHPDRQQDESDETNEGKRPDTHPDRQQDESGETDEGKRPDTHPDRQQDESDETNEGKRPDTHPDRQQDESGETDEGKRPDTHPDRQQDESGETDEGKRPDTHPDRQQDESGETDEGKRPDTHPDRQHDESGETDEGTRPDTHPDRQHDESGETDEGTRPDTHPDRQHDESGETDEGTRPDTHPDRQQDEGGQMIPASLIEGRLIHVGPSVNSSAQVNVMKRTEPAQPIVGRKMDQPPPMPVPAIHPPTSQNQMGSPQHQMRSPQHQMGSPQHQMRSPQHQMGSPQHQMGSSQHQMRSPQHQMRSPQHQMRSTQHQMRSPQHHQSQMNPPQYIMPEVDPLLYQNTFATRVVDSQPCFTSTYMNYAPYPGLNVSSVPFVPASHNANIAVATTPERPHTRPGRVSPTSQLINTNPYKNIPFIPGIPDLPFNVRIDDNLSESGQFDALVYRRPEAEIEYLKMMEELRFCANKIMGWPLFIKDNIVAAPYNSLLFRAKMIEEHADNKVTILYVDYGNYAVLDIQHLKAIPPHLAQIPEQAGRFCISKPGRAPFTDRECTAFRKVTQDNICIAGQMGMKTSDVIDVRLFVSNNNGIYNVMELIASLAQQRLPGMQIPHAHVVEATSHPPPGQQYFAEARSQSGHVHSSTGDNRAQYVQGHLSAGFPTSPVRPMSPVQSTTGETRIQSPANNNDRSGPDTNTTCTKCGLAGHSVWQCLARDRAGGVTIATAQVPECSQEVNTVTSFDLGAWQEEPQPPSNRSFNFSRHNQHHGKPWGHRDVMRTSPKEVYVPPPARQPVVSPTNSGNDQRVEPGQPRIPTPDAQAAVSEYAAPVTCSSPHSSITSSHSGADPTFVGFDEDIWVEEGVAQIYPPPKKSARNLIMSHIRGSQDGGNMICFQCGSKTHQKKDCPEIQRLHSRHSKNKPKNERRNQRH